MSVASRWPLSIRVLHWLGAAAILCMFALGFVMVNVVDDPGARFDLYQAHKSLGIFVLALMLARLALRLSQAGPAPTAAAPPWRWRAAAATMHAFLYALTIALILAGYAMVSTSPLPLPVALPFGFKVPNLLAGDGELSDRFKQAHHVLASVLALLICGHAAVAIKHHILDRDGALRRMTLF